MLNWKGKKVLITGGASGIGRRMGEMVLERGAELIVWDINQAGLDETLTAFRSLGDVSGYRVDLSNREQITQTATLVLKRHGVPDVLINNAGIVVGKYFQDHSPDEIVRTIEINTEAPMLVTHAFLPDILKRGTGHICNIASSAGLISNPRMSVYAASKWAVIGWSDSLRLEMEQQNLPIGVTTVTPYYINTGMFNGVRSLIPLLKPESVARKVIRGIERKRIYVSMPWSVNLVRLAQGILPVRAFDYIADKMLGIYHTMDRFTGRTSK